MRSQLLHVIAVVAPLLIGGGCSAPWAPFSRTAEVPAHASATSSANLAGSTPRADTQARLDSTSSGLPVEESATSPDMAGVLDKLQQIRQIDPTAEQKLIEQLRGTPPDSWPLVAEQFRASLAYHEKLFAAEQNATSEGKALAERGLPAGGGSAGASLTPQTESERPSAPIGALVDPRRSDKDGVSSEALARATPYSMPLPSAGDVANSLPSSDGRPADFASDGPVYPMRSSSTDSASSTQPAQHWPATDGVPTVAHARLETATDYAQFEGPPHDLNVVDANWQQLVEQAAADLASRVAKSPATTAEVHQHVSLRMLRLLAGDTEKALEPIPHVSTAEHDYWSKQLFALATYLDHHSQSDDKRRAAASVTHLDEAVSHLRELGSLSVRNLSFCKNVYGYGAIEPYDADQFSPGHRVSLYVEVENYHSKSTEKGYCTSLGSAYEILNEKGERVGGGDIPDVDDCCRSRRRDFHMQYQLALPEKLPPGRYRLAIVIKDRQSDKIGHAEASFEIKGLAP